jgi:hypothetical protein
VVSKFKQKVVGAVYDRADFVEDLHEPRLEAKDESVVLDRI